MSVAYGLVQEREVSIELENTPMPNKLFARGNGYYGQTEITNVRVKNPFL